jgi:hypothetical protein
VEPIVLTTAVLSNAVNNMQVTQTLRNILRERLQGRGIQEIPESVLAGENVDRSTVDEVRAIVPEEYLSSADAFGISRDAVEEARREAREIRAQLIGHSLRGKQGLHSMQR